VLESIDAPWTGDAMTSNLLMDAGIVLAVFLLGFLWGEMVGHNAHRFELAELIGRYMPRLSSTYVLRELEQAADRRESGEPCDEPESRDN
jgi:hypothetical protein